LHFLQAEAVIQVLAPQISPATDLATSTAWLETTGFGSSIRLTFKDAGGKGLAINPAAISVTAGMTTPQAGVATSHFELADARGTVSAAHSSA
jgi:hypothetical protein